MPSEPPIDELPQTAPEPVRPSPSLAELWWAIPAAGFLLLLAVGVMIGGQADPVGAGTSYDASSAGYRAAYLLLDELKYPVERSKRPTGGGARFVLSPASSAKEAETLKQWVMEGGTLVLADAKTEFAGSLGLKLDLETFTQDPKPEPASAPGIKMLAGGDVRVSWPNHEGRVWAKLGGEPAIMVYPFGQGSIWLLNRPKLFTNKLIREGDNAILLCRLADELLRDGHTPLAFDEFVHGMRDRPGVGDLLLRPPALAMTLEALLVMGIVLWHYIPRFGTIRTIRPRSRRSKEEFLDAMGSLLERKGNFEDAFSTARDALAADLARELGLPPGTDRTTIAQEAARRRPVDGERLKRLMATGIVSPVNSSGTFLHLLNELESAHDEFFDRRHAR